MPKRIRIFPFEFRFDSLYLGNSFFVHYVDVIDVMTFTKQLKAVRTIIQTTIMLLIDALIFRAAQYQKDLCTPIFNCDKI